MAAPGGSKKSRAVEYARVYLIQTDSAQACEANHNGVLIVPCTSCEVMYPAAITKEVIGEVPGTVLREVFITLDQAELIGRDFLQQGAATNAKRAVTSNRVGQVSLNLKLDRTTVARSGVGFHQFFHTKYIANR